MSELVKRAPKKSSPKQHAVIVDAGSSGSRVYVYSWQNNEGHGDGSLPKLSQVGETRKTTPGISKFGGKKLKKLWDKHLKDLVMYAQDIVPRDEHYRTPVFVLATAGMRMLPENDQRDILQATCDLLRTSTDFYLPDCSSHISVIDGETEGLYGWLALNYLLGDDGKIFSSKNQAKSYGFMDMGGASAQIAFSPNTTEAERHWDDLFHVNIRTLDGITHDWKVFVSTWLGFGANEARNRFSEHLMAKAPPKKEVIQDPCLPTGTELSYDGTSQNSTVKFKGEGDFDHCLSSMYPLLQKELPCKDDPCLFNGVHVPAIDFNVNRFVGVSEYWYTANDVMKMGGKYDFLKFSSKTRDFCGTSWDEILDDHSDISKDILRGACFKASWIINILHEGFGIPISNSPSPDKHKQKRSLDSGHKQEHISISELMLHDPGENNVTFVPYVSGSSHSKRDIHDFLDPFQSAVKINDQELSWTLGRAVLYASSLVPAVDVKQAKVGYLTAGGEGADNRFVAGGELESSADPSYFRVPVPDQQAVGFGMVFAVAIVGVLIFLYAVLHSMCGKSQANFAYGNFKNKIFNLLDKCISFVRRRGKRFDNEDEYNERLLEEGNRYAMNEIPHIEEPGASNWSADTHLGTTTSMVDLKSMMPSRMGSRLGMRPEHAASAASFNFGGEDFDGLTTPEPRQSVRKVASNSFLSRKSPI